MERERERESKIIIKRVRESACVFVHSGEREREGVR